MNKYFSMEEKDNVVNLLIYGDITSWEWFESDVSSYTLSKKLEGVEAERINVYINSYGGEVAEGLAIYNQLKRNKAKVVTYCDGFACSAASVVFMAGDERIMGDASLLLIHNAWSCGSGDSNALRKMAEDLEVITSASIQVYKQHVNISDEALKQMMDRETWVSSEKALEQGFATSVSAYESDVPSQSARNSISKLILGQTVEMQQPYHFEFDDLFYEKLSKSMFEMMNKEPKIEEKSKNKIKKFFSAMAKEGEKNEE